MIYEYLLDGFHCAACGEKVVREIKRLDYVTDAEINIATGRIIITAEKADASLLTELKKAVRSTGHGVTVKAYNAAARRLCLGQGAEHIAEHDEAENARTVQSDEVEKVAVTAQNGAINEADIETTATKATAHSDHSHHHQNKNTTFILRLFLAAVLFFGGVFTNDGLSAVLFILSAAAAGYDTLFSGIRGLFRLNIDEEFLMSAAAVAACFIGEFAEAALVLILNFIGQKVEATAAKRSRNSISRLSEIRPDTARLKDGTIISADEVEKGMELVIFPFERIAVDGEVTGGISSVDASAITGESMPISAREGTKLLSGMLNGEGRLFMRADAPAENSTAARIIRLVEESAAVKGSSERLITRFAKIYTPAVMLLCLIVATVPVAFGGSINEWLYKALSILVAACPCALVISVPLAFFAGIGAASKKGILIKGGKFVERLAVCDTAAFDKTGTVTDGTLKIERIYTANGFSEAELLATAKTAELTSSHPIARAICAATNLETDDGEYNEIAGEGVIFSGKKRIVCGSKRLMQDMGIDLSDLNNCQVLVAIDGRLAGGFTFTDNIRSDAAEVIRNLKKLGIKNITMLTGDNEKNALTAAKSGNIKNVYFGLLPEDKVDHVARLKKGSSGVIFVGDGINDAPVLAASDVGFAMGLGSDAATFAADAILTANSLFALPDAIKISRKTMKTVRFNVIFPLIIKAAVMISALIYPIMWLAVVADVAVMLLTVLNAARLIK